MPRAAEDNDGREKHDKDEAEGEEGGREQPEAQPEAASHVAVQSAVVGVAVEGLGKESRPGGARKGVVQAAHANAAMERLGDRPCRQSAAAGWGRWVICVVARFVTAGCLLSVGALHGRFFFRGRHRRGQLRCVDGGLCINLAMLAGQAGITLIAFND